jgi:hypothetical protein
MILTKRKGRNKMKTKKQLKASRLGKLTDNVHIYYSPLRNILSTSTALFKKKFLKELGIEYIGIL